MKIKTSMGFKDFKGFISQGIRPVFKLTTTNGKSLICTDDHQLKIDCGDYVELMWLREGDVLFDGDIIASIEPVGEQEVFDAFDVEEIHDYITNDLISHNCSLILLDEFAFLPNSVAEEFVSSVFPTLSSSKESKLVLISTPNGVSNPFYKYWKEAEEGTNGFKAVRGYYNEIHDEAWAQEQRKLLRSEQRFNAEILCNFESSSHTLIDGKFLVNIPFVKPIHIAYNDSLFYFENPLKDHVYVMTVDVSRGRDMDYSAFTVFDVTSLPYKVVATFKNNHINTMEYPQVIYQVAHLYNDATVVIENNDLGEAVANELWYTIEYPEVIWTKDGKISNSGIIGVRTTKSVKQKGCSSIKEVIENNQLVLNDYRIIEELGGYVASVKGVYSAQDTRINDDLCSTLFLFGWFIEQDYFKGISDTDINKTLQAKYQQSLSDDIVPFGFITNQFEEDNGFTPLTEDQIELLRH